MLSVDSIYEKLNEAASIRGFIIASVAIFDTAVDQLINRVFRKTDFVVQSVIDSLFETSGPLSELSVRLKVLVGLGVIKHEVFEDINAFLQLKETLNNAEQEHEFDDQIVLEFVNSLNLFEDKSMLRFEPESTEIKDSLLYQVKARRREKLIRSCLILTITNIYQQLQVESPL